MNLRVALVHDWLVSQRGGEAVLEALVKLFPDAPIYTLVLERSKLSPLLRDSHIETSFLQTLPGAGPKGFRKFLPIFPSAVARWDFSKFDLIVSTSHCVAKAAGARQGIPHISYVHTPMRYIWDQWPHYAPKSAVKRLLAEPIRRGLQKWDYASSQRESLRLIANSRFVAERIQRVWDRKARVVYPPVDVDYFRKVQGSARSYWCVLSALVPYKRVELAVEWANRFGRELVVIGDGPERERLTRLAGPNVSLRGRVSREEIALTLAGARGLIFPGTEDFGIVPLEAIAAGVPVIAYGEGGALETVSAEESALTGVFFYRSDVESIESAALEVSRGWETGKFSREPMVQWTEQFSAVAFERSIRKACREEIAQLGL